MRYLTTKGLASYLLALLLLATARHELHARTYVVNGAHRSAADSNEGSEAAPLRTINRAAQLAHAGDTVVVRAGIYRERVAPARGGEPGKPIVYAAADGETVIIKGSEIWQPNWRKASDSQPIYSGDLEERLFQNERFHAYHTPLKAAPDGQHLTLGQVFVDGLQLREVDDARALVEFAGTWLADVRGKSISIHFLDATQPPEEQLVEITVRDRIFAPHRRGLGHLHVKGFTMEHCANQFPAEFWRSDTPQAGALGCRAGHHWLIEHNTIRFAKSIGIDCGYEGRHDLEGGQPTPANSGYHLIRQNRVSDNGCCGIAGMRSIGTRIIENVIERNNCNLHTAPEIAGIKVHFFIDGLIENNLVRDNHAHGIWLDNVYRNARVTRNLIVANRGSGVFVELGVGPVRIDNNVIAKTKPSVNAEDERGDGLYSHDASGIEFVNNLVFDSHRFGAFHRKVTQREGAGASNITLLNNLFIGNRGGHLSLPYPGPDARGNRSDHNLYSPQGHFVVNHWGGTDTDTIISRAEQKLGRRPPSWKDFGPQLNFKQWKQVMGMDEHSLQTESAIATISDQMVLSLNVNEAARLSATPREGLNRDYFGELIPSQHALPGPFQRIEGGPQSISVWPSTAQFDSQARRIQIADTSRRPIRCDWNN